MPAVAACFAMCLIGRSLTNVLSIFSVVVAGQTPSQFEQMVTMPQVLDMVSRLDRMKDLALLCINDDVTADHDEITAYIRGWQEKRWGAPAAWEADVPHHKRRDDADVGQSRVGGEDVIPVEEYEPDPRYWR